METTNDSITTAPVLILTGPTASGKTSFAVELARQWDAEIVSADSRQVYRYLDIGTAKPTLDERQGIPHHGFDVVDPSVRYSAGQYAVDARRWIADIRDRGKQAIVVGGSGLYLQALVDGFSGDDVKDDAIREKLFARLDAEGLSSLYAELQQVDPEYARKTQPADQQRILRALEVCQASGQPFSSLHRKQRDSAPFQSVWVGIDQPREELYRRIDERVDQMMNRGLLAEVRGLCDRGYKQANALKSVGYEEIIAWMDGEVPDLSTALLQIKQNTRRYAKRQLTWFRRNPRIRWIAPDTLAELAPADLLQAD